MLTKYDVIVVGAGHAGCEAAHCAATMGSSVLLVTMNMNTIAQMSCNPAMGGVAKGQILREVDALGGGSGIVSDKSAIQFRMLNKSKGPAMWSPRSQNDRQMFSTEWRMLLERNKNVDFWQDMCTEIIVEDGNVQGVKTALGIEIKSKTVILTNGTFLNGLIHLGEKQFGGGRAAERSSTGITEQLVQLGFSVMVYTTDNVELAIELERVGCVSVMPLASPIGTGQGIKNSNNLKNIIKNANIPIIVDAGIGTASDATIAMELGCDAVLLNSAIAMSDNPVQMAEAMKHAVIAGRKAFNAKRMKISNIAIPSSKKTDALS